MPSCGCCSIDANGALLLRRKSRCGNLWRWARKHNVDSADGTEFIPELLEILSAGIGEIVAEVPDSVVSPYFTTGGSSGSNYTSTRCSTGTPPDLGDEYPVKSQRPKWISARDDLRRLEEEHLADPAVSSVSLNGRVRGVLNRPSGTGWAREYALDEITEELDGATPKRGQIFRLPEHLYPVSKRGKVALQRLKSRVGSRVAFKEISREATPRPAATPASDTALKHRDDEVSTPMPTPIDAAPPEGASHDERMRRLHEISNLWKSISTSMQGCDGFLSQFRGPLEHLSAEEIRKLPRVTIELANADDYVGLSNSVFDLKRNIRALHTGWICRSLRAAMSCITGRWSRHVDHQLSLLEMRLEELTIKDSDLCGALEDLDDLDARSTRCIQNLKDRLDVVFSTRDVDDSASKASMSDAFTLKRGAIMLSAVQEGEHSSEPHSPKGPSSPKSGKKKGSKRKAEKNKSVSTAAVEEALAARKQANRIRRESKVVQEHAAQGRAQQRTEGLPGLPGDGYDEENIAESKWYHSLSADAKAKWLMIKFRKKRSVLTNWKDEPCRYALKLEEQRVALEEQRAKIYEETMQLREALTQEVSDVMHELRVALAAINAELAERTRERISLENLAATRKIKQVWREWKLSRYDWREELHLYQDRKRQVKEDFQRAFAEWRSEPSRAEKLAARAAMKGVINSDHLLDNENRPLNMRWEVMFTQQLQYKEILEEELIKVDKEHTFISMTLGTVDTAHEEMSAAAKGLDGLVDALLRMTKTNEQRLKNIMARWTDKSPPIMPSCKSLEKVLVSFDHMVVREQKMIHDMGGEHGFMVRLFHIFETLDTLNNDASSGRAASAPVLVVNGESGPTSLSTPASVASHEKPSTLPMRDPHFFNQLRTLLHKPAHSGLLSAAEMSSLPVLAESLGEMVNSWLWHQEHRVVLSDEINELIDFIGKTRHDHFEKEKRRLLDIMCRGEEWKEKHDELKRQRTEEKEAINADQIEPAIKLKEEALLDLQPVVKEHRQEVESTNCLREQLTKEQNALSKVNMVIEKRKREAKLKAEIAETRQRGADLRETLQSMDEELEHVESDTHLLETLRSEQGRISAKAFNDSDVMPFARQSQRKSRRKSRFASSPPNPNADMADSKKAMSRRKSRAVEDDEVEPAARSSMGLEMSQKDTEKRATQRQQRKSVSAGTDPLKRSASISARRQSTRPAPADASSQARKKGRRSVFSRRATEVSEQVTDMLKATDDPGLDDQTSHDMPSLLGDAQLTSANLALMRRGFIDGLGSSKPVTVKSAKKRAEAALQEKKDAEHVMLQALKKIHVMHRNMLENHSQEEVQQRFQDLGVHEDTIAEAHKSHEKIDAAQQREMKELNERLEMADKNVQKIATQMHQMASSRPSEIHRPPELLLDEEDSDISGGTSASSAVSSVRSRVSSLASEPESPPVPEPKKAGHRGRVSTFRYGGGPRPSMDTRRLSSTPGRSTPSKARSREPSEEGQRGSGRLSVMKKPKRLSDGLDQKEGASRRHRASMMAGSSTQLLGDIRRPSTCKGPAHQNNLLSPQKGEPQPHRRDSTMRRASSMASFGLLKDDGHTSHARQHWGSFHVANKMMKRPKSAKAAQETPDPVPERKRPWSSRLMRASTLKKDTPPESEDELESFGQEQANLLLDFTRETPEERMRRRQKERLRAERLQARQKAERRALKQQRYADRETAIAKAIAEADAHPDPSAHAAEMERMMTTIPHWDEAPEVHTKPNPPAEWTRKGVLELFQTRGLHHVFSRPKNEEQLKPIQYKAGARKLAAYMSMRPLISMEPGGLGVISLEKLGDEKDDGAAGLPNSPEESGLEDILQMKPFGKADGNVHTLQDPARRLSQPMGTQGSIGKRLSFRGRRANRLRLSFVSESEDGDGEDSLASSLLPLSPAHLPLVATPAHGLKHRLTDLEAPGHVVWAEDLVDTCAITPRNAGTKVKRRNSLSMAESMLDLNDAGSLESLPEEEEEDHITTQGFEVPPIRVVSAVEGMFVLLRHFVAAHVEDNLCQHLLLDLDSSASRRLSAKQSEHNVKAAFVRQLMKMQVGRSNGGPLEIDESYKYRMDLTEQAHASSGNDSVAVESNHAGLFIQGKHGGHMETSSRQSGVRFSQTYMLLTAASMKLSKIVRMPEFETKRHLPIRFWKTSPEGLSPSEVGSKLEVGALVHRVGIRELLGCHKPDKDELVLSVTKMRLHARGNELDWLMSNFSAGLSTELPSFFKGEISVGDSDQSATLAQEVRASTSTLKGGDSATTAYISEENADVSISTLEHDGVSSALTLPSCRMSAEDLMHSHAASGVPRVLAALDALGSTGATSRPATQTPSDMSRARSSQGQADLPRARSSLGAPLASLLQSASDSLRSHEPTAIQLAAKGHRMTSPNEFRQGQRWPRDFASPTPTGAAGRVHRDAESLRASGARSVPPTVTSTAPGFVGCVPLLPALHPGRRSEAFRDSEAQDIPGVAGSPMQSVPLALSPALSTSTPEPRRPQSTMGTVRRQSLRGLEETPTQTTEALTQRGYEERCERSRAGVGSRSDAGSRTGAQTRFQVWDGCHNVMQQTCNAAFSPAAAPDYPELPALSLKEQEPPEIVKSLKGDIENIASLFRSKRATMATPAAVEELVAEPAGVGSLCQVNTAASPVGKQSNESSSALPGENEVEDEQERSQEEEEEADEEEEEADDEEQEEDEVTCQASRRTAVHGSKLSVMGRTAQRMVDVRDRNAAARRRILEDGDLVGAQESIIGSEDLNSELSEPITSYEHDWNWPSLFSWLNTVDDAKEMICPRTQNLRRLISSKDELGEKEQLRSSSRTASPQKPLPAGKASPRAGTSQDILRGGTPLDASSPLTIAGKAGLGQSPARVGKRDAPRANTSLGLASTSPRNHHCVEGRAADASSRSEHSVEALRAGTSPGLDGPIRREVANAPIRNERFRDATRAGTSLGLMNTSPQIERGPVGTARAGITRAGTACGIARASVRSGAHDDAVRVGTSMGTYEEVSLAGAFLDESRDMPCADTPLGLASIPLRSDQRADASRARTSCGMASMQFPNETPVRAIRAGTSLGMASPSTFSHLHMSDARAGTSLGMTSRSSPSGARWDSARIDSSLGLVSRNSPCMGTAGPDTSFGNTSPIGTSAVPGRRAGMQSLPQMCSSQVPPAMRPEKSGAKPVPSVLGQKHQGAQKSKINVAMRLNSLVSRR